MKNQTLKQLPRKPYKIIQDLFINGQFVKSSNGKTFQAKNPTDQSVIGTIQKGTKQDMDKAIKAARQAFQKGPWSKMKPTDRAKLMFKFADLIQQNSQELAILETMDNGKPIKQSRQDMKMVYQVIRYYGGWVDKIQGTVIKTDGPYFAYTKKQPVGVVAQIIPWNFPLSLLSWKIGPALATGCTIILKPASNTPLTALKIAQYSRQVGFPPGVFNVVPCQQDIGQYLALHNDIDKIAFTGSTQVGLKLMQKSHKEKLKRITLQLGGKSANIITKNCNKQLAAQQAIHALFFNAGQCCIAGSRTYIQQQVYDEIVNKIVSKVKTIIVGDPLDSTVQQGPLVSKDQFDKVMKYIQKGIKQGAKLVTGGNKIGQKGWFLQPTIFTQVTDQMTIAKQEIFGPVMCIFKYTTNQEVIKRANQSEYGLGAGIVTQDVNQLYWFADRFKSGTVFGNCYNVTMKNTPFGGYKNSGIGRELGQQGLNNYLETKTVIIQTQKQYKQQ